MKYIGLTQQQVEKELAKLGITNFVYQDNFVYPLENSTKLVTNCTIVGDTAYITLGSFKLKL